jgi:hypothetical protein
MPDFSIFRDDSIQLGYPFGHKFQHFIFTALGSAEHDNARQPKNFLELIPGIHLKESVASDEKEKLGAGVFIAKLSERMHGI